MYNLRYYLNITPTVQPKIFDTDFELFSKIIEKFKINSEKIGAELVFVYLPSSDYFNVKKEGQFEEIILKLIKQNNIRYINLVNEFSSPIDFNRIFFWDNITPGHYNKNGHKMIYNNIKKFNE